MSEKVVKHILFLIIVGILLCGGCDTGNPATGRGGYRQVIDALGRKVEVPADADKFVAIGPGCLRLYCYVADTEKLVGVENFEVVTEVNGKPYMQANPQLKDYPIIGFGGPGNTPDAESLLIADPDVIFTMYNYEISGVEELQEKTGIPVVALSYGETEIFDPILHNSLQLIGAITGNEKRAGALIDYFEGIKKDLEARVANIEEEEKATVYLGAQSMGGVHGIESTSGNYSLFNAVQARNVVDMIGIHKYAVLDKEKILELDPEIIFLDAGGISMIKKDYDSNPEYYANLSAFANNNAHLLLPYNYYYTNLEVALANAYYIGKVLYPEQFSGIDPAEKFDEVTTEMLGVPLYQETAQRYGHYGVITF
jgi:iron complex transport system substrate-binding protein